MCDAITESDKLKLIEFISSTDRYTCGEKVEEFERAWSDWLKCNYSLFVTSGSTANSLLISSVKELYKIPDGSKVLVPACTWVTNVSPVFQNNLEPVFCDINLNDYSFDLDNLPDDDIRIVFVTHLLGLNAPIEALKEKYPNAIFLEDICESHGVTDKRGNRRGGGTGSTFSFYFGHHMTTIEGGMVCTNNKELYELMRLKRSHGMARHLLPENYDDVIAKYPNINPKFLFLTDGYNFRNTEINAVLGIEQLKRLDENIRVRRKNYVHYMVRLNRMRDIFHVPKYDEFNSSFTLPFVCKTRENRDIFIKIVEDLGIEYRPIVAGNLLIHPFLEKWKDSVKTPNATILNDYGAYVGNHQSVTTDAIDALFDRIECDMKGIEPTRKINDKTAVVIGSSGQDGSYMVEMLLEKGYDVHEINRTGLIQTLTKNGEPRIHVRRLDGHRGDVCDLASLVTILKKIRPCELYNLSAYRGHVESSFESPVESSEVNGMGALNVLEAIRLTDQTKTCRVFQASSSEIFGKAAETPQTETTPLNPDSPYGFAKAMAYHATKVYREKYGMFASSGIMYNHESPLRDESFVTRKITKAVVDIKNCKLDCLYLGNLDAMRDWGHARDYCECAWRMLQANDPGDFVISTGKLHSVRDLVSKAFKYVGIDVVFEGFGIDEVAREVATNKIVVRVYQRYFREDMGYQLVGDSSKAREQLGWEPTATFDEIIEEMIDRDQMVRE
jgi:GDP-mannose 4,6-dehydratase